MIKPPWAFSIWSDANHIFAELPAINGHLTHIVKVENTAKGLQKMLYLAKSRNATSKIGSKGEPTQSQIERIEYDPAMVRKVGKPKFTQDQKLEVKTLLRKMGMI